MMVALTKPATGNARAWARYLLVVCALLFGYVLGLSKTPPTSSSVWRAVYQSRPQSRDGILPELIIDSYSLQACEAYKSLFEAEDTLPALVRAVAEAFVDPFASIAIAIPVAPPVISPTNGAGGETKALVGPSFLRAIPSCVVFSAGIATDSSFETSMAQLGCAVHAFDCTISSLPQGTDSRVRFHKQCLGKSASFQNNAYTRGRNDSFEFVSFSRALAYTRSQRVDVLKFDIEGFEWGLFDDFLSSSFRPSQVLFELHTSGANRAAVPPDVVRGRDSTKVVELFQKFWNAGYRVVSKEINVYDARCAEFVLVHNVHAPLVPDCSSIASGMMTPNAHLRTTNRTIVSEPRRKSGKKFRSTRS